MSPEQYTSSVRLLAALATDSADLGLLIRSDPRIDKNFLDGLPSVDHCPFAEYVSKVVGRLGAFSLLDLTFLRALAGARPHQRGRLARTTIELGLYPRISRPVVLYIVHTREGADLASRMESAVRSALSQLVEVVPCAAVGLMNPDATTFAPASYVVDLRHVGPLQDAQGWRAMLAKREVVVLQEYEPEQVIDLLASDFSEIPPPPHMGSSLSPLRGASRRDIRRVACRCVDKGALLAFLWDLNIDGGSLNGDSLHEKILALLHLADRDAIVEHFLDFLWQERRACVENHLRRLRSEPTT